MFWVGFLHHELDFVEVGLALAPAGDLDEIGFLQLLDEFADARLAHAHVGGEPILTGEAAVVVPGVMQEHRIGDFGAEAQFGIFQNEIGDLGKPAARNRIVRGELDVAISENVADVARLRRHAVIVSRLELHPGVIPRRSA